MGVEEIEHRQGNELAYRRTPGESAPLNVEC